MTTNDETPDSGSIESAPDPSSYDAGSIKVLEGLEAVSQTTRNVHRGQRSRGTSSLRVRSCR